MTDQKRKGQTHLKCRGYVPSRGKSADVYCESDHGRWVSMVRQFLEDLGYGQVVLTVHDSRVVQVECTQKVRF